jgi:hypothetical protein
MKKIGIALLLGICVAAHSAESTITEEFIQLLKENTAKKAAGTNDFKQFFFRLTELADKGDPSAQFLVGMTVLNARRNVAEKYMAASAQSGCAGAEMGLGLLAMLNKQPTTGIAHFRAAAEKGDAMAQVAISGIYERGDNGFDKSLPKAYAWLRLAERQTFSNGGLLAIRDAMKKLRGSMTEDDIVNSEKDFSEISVAIPKVNYYFCGQFNIDASRDPDIPYYFKF